MEVMIRFSSSLSPLAGKSKTKVVIDEGATVGSLRNYLCTQFPDLSQQFMNSVTVIAGNIVGPTEHLKDGQEVSFLTPISGGC